MRFLVIQQPQPQPQSLLPQVLPLPPQITKTMMRMMIHHQLLPKAQIPEEALLHIGKRPPDYGCRVAPDSFHSMRSSQIGVRLFDALGADF